jgi:hypothetical protein
VIDGVGQDAARHILIRTVPRSNSETDRACRVSKDFLCLLKTQPWFGCGPPDSGLVIVTTDDLSASYNNNKTIKEDVMGRACSTNVAKRNTYRILVRKPEGKRPLGRRRRRCSLFFSQLNYLLVFLSARILVRASF